MKKVLFALFAVAAFCSFGASATESFKSALESNDYATAVNYMSRTKAIITEIPSAAVANALYDAAAAQTNFYKMTIAASVAYSFGDKTKLTDLVMNKSGATGTVDENGRFVLDYPNTQAYPDLYMMANLSHVLSDDHFGTWKKKVVNSAGKEVVVDYSLNMLEPDLMLAFYKKMAAKGNYEVASLAFCQAARNVLSKDPAGFADHFNAEWKKFIDDTFTVKVVETLSASRIYNILFYYSVVDRINNDSSQAITAKFTTSAVMSKLAKAGYNWIPYNAKRIEYNQLLAETSIKLSSRIYGAKKLDAINKNKEASTKLFPYVVENGTWSEAADFAVYIGNVDFILDIYKKIDDKATAKQIEVIIPALNAIDAGYRTADLALVLKNINKKYTIKLYDDRATWEPILSKVRAMIDTL